MTTRVCLWGKGYGISRVLQMCEEEGVEVLAIFDSNQALWGQVICDTEVVSPDQLMNYDMDYLVVTCLAYDTIISVAEAKGFPREKCLNFFGDNEKTLSKLKMTQCVWSCSYDMEEDALCTTFNRHCVNGKVTQDIPTLTATAVEKRAIKTVYVAFKLACQDRTDIPPLYQVGENWQRCLDQCMQPLYDMADAGDEQGLIELLRNFCRNSLSRHIMGGEEGYKSFSSHPTIEPWLQHNLEVWLAMGDPDATLEDAAMPPIGNPYGYDVDGHLINWNSFVNHNRAYRLAQLLEEEDHPIIAEIGGGFGGFAYHLMRRGVKATYIDFDLPENLLIGSYYNSMAYPNKNFLYYEGKDMDLSPENLRQYDAVFLPNFMLPKMEDLSTDLFVNTISFSEMEYDTIGEYFAQIDRIGCKYFYHENLSCHPEYKGFPAAIFPKTHHFRLLFKSFSSWHGLDAHTSGHSYMEHLYERRSEI